MTGLNITEVTYRALRTGRGYNNTSVEGRATVPGAIACDHCGTAAPPRAEILAHHEGRKGGLNAMGWQCSGGRYTCPKCRQPEDRHQP